METKPQISFIIVNYNSRKLLDNCISSIRSNASSFFYEIIIANNDSAVLSVPESKVINLKNNRGYGAGCNAGVKIAQGEILCFLNPDTEISKDIKDIIRYFNTDKKTGIIGPKLITLENKTQQWCAGTETSLWNTLRNNLGFSKSKNIWTSQKPTKCAWVSGACLFILKELFSALDGFDENFFMYFEDEDLCKRVRENGHKVIYFPEFTVRHLGGKSFGEKKEQKKLFYESQDYYFKKHFGKIKHNLLKLIRRLVLIK